MAFWWVFQGKSYKRAREHSYLWAPQKDQAGRTRFYWSTLENVLPNDLIFSGHARTLAAISIATGRAYESDPTDERDCPRRPRRGWRLDLTFCDLATPLNYNDFMPLLMPLLPERYSPFSSSNGRSRQGYLYSLADKAGQLLLQKIGESEPEVLQRIIPTGN